MSDAATRISGWIGRALPRLEDERFLTGAAKYVDDLQLPGMLHAVFARSPVAHARIRAIRAEGVRSVPGVPIIPAQADLVEIPHPVLARGRVRYAGEPFAVVVAESAAAAADAAELVKLDFEELPVAIGPRDALRGKVVLHDDAPDNVLVRWHRAEGDVDGAFARAAHVVRKRIRMPRLVAAALEPRGAVASYDDAADLLTIWISAQDQHRQLAGLSAVLRRSPDRLRIVVPDVGGAFGSKGVPGPESAVVGLAAVRLGHLLHTGSLTFHWPPTRAAAQTLTRSWRSTATDGCSPSGRAIWPISAPTSMRRRRCRR